MSLSHPPAFLRLSMKKKNELSQQYRRVRQVAKAYHGVQRTELMSSFSAQWSKLPDIKTTSALY